MSVTAIPIDYHTWAVNSNGKVVFNFLDGHTEAKYFQNPKNHRFFAYDKPMTDFILSHFDPSIRFDFKQGTCLQQTRDYLDQHPNHKLVIGAFGVYVHQMKMVNWVYGDPRYKTVADMMAYHHSIDPLYLKDCTHTK
jgi:hypothetical protein